MQQTILTEQSTRILDMLGPHGIIAILSTVVIVRAIRVLWYFDKQQSFLLTLLIAAIIGAGSVYFGADANDAKKIYGGAFITMIATPLVYEIMKWCVGFAYDRLRWQILINLYFFLSPRPLRKKENGELVEHQAESLTVFFDKARLDKDAP